MRVFSEWWLAKQKFSEIDAFLLASFPGATTNGFNGLSVKYQVIVDFVFAVMFYEKKVSYHN